MPSRAGSPNRNKQHLLNRLKDIYGSDFNPIMRIADNCSVLQIKADKIPYEADEKVVALQKCNAEWSRMAEYVVPKLKAVEISGEIVADIDIGESIESVKTVLLEHGISFDDL